MRRWFPQIRRSRKTSKPYAKKESIASTREGIPSTSGEARGGPWHCARIDSLQEEGGVADFSEADRDAMEARKDFWSLSGGFFPPPYHAQRTTFMHQKSPAYIEVVRQTKKRFGQFVREQSR